MNYAQARQRQSDGRWDWTVRNDDTIRPSGYCAGPPSECAGLVPPDLWRREREAAAPFRAKYHIDGHATREEAERCFYGYQLDRQLNELAAGSGMQHRCEAKWNPRFHDAVICGAADLRSCRDPGHWLDRPPAESRYAGITREVYAPDGAVGCEAWTQKALAIGNYSSDLTWLCDGHRTRDIYAALHPFRPGTQLIYS